MDHDLCHWEIPADDPEALVKFYTELFGWTFETTPMGDEPYHLFRTSEKGVGGGIYSGGILELINSTLSDNVSRFGTGGGLYAREWKTIIANSTISHNRAKNGGGIYKYGPFY